MTSEGRVQTPGCHACEYEPGSEEAERCPKSRRPCGHHCNHSFSVDICDWCAKEWGDD
jgi:hypothetical protein